MNGKTDEFAGISDQDVTGDSFARKEVTRTILQALWKHRGRTGAAIALLVAAKLLMVLVPFLLKSIVDRLSEPGLLVLPVFLLLGYALIRFGGSLFTELRDVVFVRVAQRAVADFTLRVFDHLQRLGARFHGTRQTGKLARDVERGTAGIGFLLGTALFTLLPTLVEMVSVVLILVMGYSAWFALVLAATFSAYFVYTVIMVRKRVVYQRHMNDLDSRASGRIVDSLLNYEAVKLNANEGLESRRLSHVLGSWVDVGIRNQASLSRLHVGQSAIIACGVATVMLLAGEQVVDARMTVGDLVLVNAYIIQICLPLNTLGLIFRQAKEAFVNAERVCDLLRKPTETGDDATLPDLDPGMGEIRFEKINFGYEAGRQILWDIDLTVPAGTTLAVVGGSGSGKSTLARLLFRFYDPSEGSVRVNGQDLRTVNVRSIRKALGIVPQDTVLFNETIAYNIAYSQPGATRDQIVQAARGARVHEFIESLPGGYETPVGERGIKLSGGERQRIAIARAILKNPSIMVFDEATSALDTRTERAIQAELERLSRGRTTLIIAHRLSTIVHADNIVVLDRGRVIEQGQHKDLLAQQGMYAQMWALQRQQSELEEAQDRQTRQPVNLVAVVAGVLDAIREVAAERGVNLYTLIGNEAARISGDPSTLQQLVWDLCLHAIAVTPPGGRIEIRLQRNGPMAHLAVTDGRSDLVSSTGQDGSEALRRAAALDPAQLAAQVQRQGGVFHSAAADVGGVTFSADFPIRAVEPTVTRRDAQRVDVQNVSVIVVDDQDEAREMIAEVLRDNGARVTEYADGEQALAAFKAMSADQWPDVLICDLSLGEMDGYEVIGRIRALEAERGAALAHRLPAIALSGFAEPEYRLRTLLAGFQIHLAKPVNTQELLATVGALLPAAPANAGSGQDKG
ncbi:ATP-binding cassette domain-containing protein [Bordetella genomosp. 4]|uniref:ABC transporter ATP-binding protein n=1 Tax=Bordetella genomosp. 4 TaxID=463044 RepID=A0A261U3Z8_9BORD|nr:ATP-binding cassette domain-containing protein [Bordetella genomosp. 4]OZI49683.1 ABC transporter ATP-binding protein [Bordetella genomosp. 4]OZI56122.1 ABC transporter ATP-binding protein [Bordetella genomosp. 4]